MLPILQAPSEINDTVRTVINNFKTIAAHLGQKYTNIFADQSLAAGLKNSHGSTQMTLKMLLCSWVICTYCLTF
jgi:enamine deaminase RidA (YjgF/YER057c/UK114 family)